MGGDGLAGVVAGMSVWDDVKVSKKTAPTPSKANGASSPKGFEQPTSEHDTFLPEALRARYKVESKIGRGAFGVALLVQSKKDNEKYVAKVMNLAQMNKKDREHMKSEVDCLDACQHPNIIRQIESYSNAQQLVLVTEYADGSDLGKEITARKRKGLTFQSKEVACIMVQLFLALEHAHKKGILHRDVKPANIFFTKLGLVKLGDFGFSKQFEETLSNPVGQTLCGTPYYLSPEMWKAQRYNKKADVWSLGIVLYEMMTLKRPFLGDNFKDLGASVCKGEYTAVPAGFDEGLVEAVRLLLTVDHTVRPDISDIVKLPVFREALLQMKEIITVPAFNAVRAGIDADIDEFLK